MSTRLNSADPNFAAQLEALLAKRQRATDDVAPSVKTILADVAKRGDIALLEYTEKFDRVRLTSASSHPEAGILSLRIGSDLAEEYARQCDPKVKDALDLAAQRIRDYHQRQMPKGERYTDAAGVSLGWQYAPLASVGIYVPGGKASYPSSVLMNAVPAKTAGVARIAMAVPTPDGIISPAVLAAAQLAGVDEIYRVGGAQAIGALAFGTASIPPVAKIVGPGNAYVAEAKRQVFGRVGIDTIAGPSEILVLADAKNDPRWIAADLLSQAEHDEMAQSILITDDAGFADAVEKEIDALLRPSPSPSPASRGKRTARSSSWRTGRARCPSSPPSRPSISNSRSTGRKRWRRASPAPGRSSSAATRRRPSAIISPGPSHVLPTSRAASFSSGLSVFDFLNRTSLIGAPQGARELLDAAATLADAEGLPMHALSLRLRGE